MSSLWSYSPRTKFEFFKQIRWFLTKRNNIKKYFFCKDIIGLENLNSQFRNWLFDLMSKTIYSLGLRLGILKKRKINNHQIMT